MNKLKPTRLDLLYTVECLTNRVEYAQKIDEERGKTKSRFEITSDSSCSDNDSENDESSLKRGANSTSDDSDEKIEILCVQFNQNLNLLATGDSNGHVAVFKTLKILVISKS